jgi:hypothetical protein
MRLLSVWLPTEEFRFRLWERAFLSMVKSRPVSLSMRWTKSCRIQPPTGHDFDSSLSPSIHCRERFSASCRRTGSARRIIIEWTVNAANRLGTLWQRLVGEILSRGENVQMQLSTSKSAGSKEILNHSSCPVSGNNRNSFPLGVYWRHVHD